MRRVVILLLHGDILVWPYCVLIPVFTQGGLERNVLVKSNYYIPPISFTGGECGWSYVFSNGQSSLWATQLLTHCHDEGVCVSPVSHYSCSPPSERVHDDTDQYRGEVSDKLHSHLLYLTSLTFSAPCSDLWDYTHHTLYSIVWRERYCDNEWPVAPWVECDGVRVVGTFLRCWREDSGLALCQAMWMSG